MNLVDALVKEFEIPYIGDDEHQVWFFRTKAGQFYHDFKVNEFIALGWDLISPDFIIENHSSREIKKEQIEFHYPEEKRPGLILSQMETFYFKMKVGDLVVIPAAGGREISIGKIGDLQTSIKHKIESEEYPQCTYIHKRSVKWIKVVDVSHDIYLFKALRAQQTISNISDCSELIFRNLFPVYVSNDGVHLTLQKESEANLKLSQNIEFLSNCVEIMDVVASIYGKEYIGKSADIKTAVGSPGFLEVILSATPISVIATVILANCIIGVEKSTHGWSIGVLAVISKVNDLINDYHNRKKTIAETRYIQAQTEKIEAETELVKAQTRELDGKAEQIAFTNSGKTTAQIEEENEQLSFIGKDRSVDKVVQISECSKKIRNSAAQNDISFDGKRIKKVD